MAQIEIQLDTEGSSASSDPKSLLIDESGSEPLCRFCLQPSKCVEGERLYTVCECQQPLCLAHPTCLLIYVSKQQPGEHRNVCSGCAQPWANGELVAATKIHRVLTAIKDVIVLLFIATAIAVVPFAASYIVKAIVWLFRGFSVFGFCWGTLCMCTVPSSHDYVFGAVVCLCLYAFKCAFRWICKSSINWRYRRALGSTGSWNDLSPARDPPWTGLIVPSPFGVFDTTKQAQGNPQPQAAFGSLSSSSDTDSNP